MKQKQHQPARSHHSAVLDEFRSLSTPEELARTETRMLLAAKIQDGMVAKNIGKKQLAELLGQNPSVITKWLSGGHNFTVDTLTDIQRVLEVQLFVLEQKPVAPKVYRLDITVVSPDPQSIVPFLGQAYTLPAIPTDAVQLSLGKMQRQIPLA